MRTTELFRLQVFAAWYALSFCTGARAQTQAASPVTVTTPLTHPISSAAALRLMPAPIVGPHYLNDPQESNAPPLSLAVDDADGVLYSRDVNRINDSAVRVDVGANDALGRSTPRNETWLATAYGVKCVDHKAGTVRHYALAEGLPATNVLAIAVDSADVWCLVADQVRPFVGPRPTQRIRLCVLDAKAQRWSERGSFEIPIPKDPMNAYKIDEGRCLLSLSQRYVAVVTSRVTSDATAFVHLCDRKSGELREVPWEKGLRADVIFIESKALSIDDSGVWFGTDHGLFRWTFASSSWNRLLPDRSVAFGAATPGENAFWVVDEPRSRPDARPFPVRQATEWRLSQVSTIDGAVASWAVPALSLPPPVPDEPLYNIGSAPGGDPGIDFSHELPIGLSVASDGTIWTTHLGRSAFGSGPSIQGSGWLHFDPLAKVWTAYGVHLNRTASAFGRPRTGYEVDTSASPDDIPVAFATIPDGAVRPLAMISSRAGAASQSNGSASQDLEVFWLRRRFPDWLCPDSSPLAASTLNAEKPGSVPLPPGLVGTRTLGPLPDPADPTLAWTVGFSDDTLLHVAPGDLSADLLAMRLGKSFAYTAGDPPTDFKSDHGQTFPLTASSRESHVEHARNVLKARPSVVALIPRPGLAPHRLPNGNASIGTSQIEPDLLVATNGFIYGVRPESDALIPLQSIGRNPYNSRGNLGLVIDTTSDVAPILYTETYFAEHNIVAWDPGRSTFTLMPDTTTVAGEREVLAVNPADGGLWLRVDGAARNGETALYMPGSVRNGHVAATGSIVVTAPVTDHGSWQLLGATAGVVWWGADVRNSTAVEVRGYDGPHRRWIAPLPAKVADPRAMDFVRPEASGEIYVACESLVGTSIWRYEGASDRWIAVADAPVGPQTNSSAPPSFYSPILRAELVTVSPNAILMAAYGTRLYRFDRLRGHWDPPVDLPKPIQTINDLTERSVAEVGGSVYIGGQAGLYRMRLIAGKEARLPPKPEWTSLMAVVPTSTGVIAGQSRPPTLHLTSIAPGHKYVYALLSSYTPQATFAGRLDIAAGHWTLYDETRGFPGNDLSARLIGDGEDGAWVVCQTGVYRYDKAADRWQQVFVQAAASPLFTLPPTSKTTSETAPIAEVSSSQVVAGNGSETDVLTQPPYRQNMRQSDTLPTIWRFANDDGRLIGKVASPAPTGGYYSAMLAKSDGDIWVRQNNDLYLVRPGAPGEPWRRFGLPQGLPIGILQQLVPGPSGELWLLNSDNAYLWKKPHD